MTCPHPDMRGWVWHDLVVAGAEELDHLLDVWAVEVVVEHQRDGERGPELDVDGVRGRARTVGGTGVPTIRGLRIPVATVVSMVADGMTVEEICRDLPDLAPDDVAEALRLAAETVP